MVLIFYKYFIRYYLVLCILKGAIQELKLYGSPTEVQCDNNNFEDFSGDGPSLIDIDDMDIMEGLDGGSGTEAIPPFPPPPPGIDGKNCPPCSIADCCKFTGVDEFQFMDAASRGGIKGEKGDRGIRGAPGESIRGPPGPPGPSGQPGTVEGLSGSVVGPPGPPGICACNMSSLMNTFVMPDLIPGPPGALGAEGKMGPPGITGMPGAPGERGAIGPKGEKGERGELGTQGPEGLQGPKGESGRDGVPGQIGPPGQPGPPGPVEFENSDPSWKPRGIFKETLGGGGLTRPGAPGNKGEPGGLGAPGPRGERGLQGSKGARGESGLKGERGERGHTGERGSQGPKGEPGGAGQDGLPGIPGANGRPSEKGEKGEPGKSGSPGPPGIVQYAMNGAGDDPNINPIAGTPGPKGDIGDAGSKGEKGDRGDFGPGGIPGVNGSPGPAGEKGEPGLDGTGGPQGLPGSKGERGERGPPGPITVTDSGTQIVTVKGDKGDSGKRGRRGKPGPAGPPGPLGRAGPAGEIGLPGWMGRPGQNGTPGLKGDKGDSGTGDGYGGRGEKGDKGDRGRDGIPGRDGTPGLPGLASTEDSIRYVPVPGPPGPPGLPGSPGLSIQGPKGDAAELPLPAYGERVFTSRTSGIRSSLEELKAIRELHELKEMKQDTEAPPQADEGLIARIVPGAVTFLDREAMTKMSSVSPVGTLAYIIEEEALLVRVNSGWQYIALGTLLPITTPAPPTTSSPQIRPPFEASNLVNNVPQPVDGPSLRMAALNEPHTGDTHGLRGADYSCYREARRAGLRGTFRAFLSSRVQNVDSIVRSVDRELPVVNLRGDVLFHSWADMFNGDGAPFPHPPRILSFNGKNVLTDLSWPHKAAWHGALPDGQRALDISCDAWHSGAGDKLGLAGSLRGAQLLEQSPYTCDKKLVLLCVEATSEHGIQRKKRNSNDSAFGEDELYSEARYKLLLDQIDKSN